MSLSATLSQDESSLALIPSSKNNRFLSIPIHQVASHQVQCTLTCPKVDPDESVRNSVFCGSTYLCVLLSDRVVVWNVTRGVVQHTIHVESKYKMHNVLSSSSTTLSLLVSANEKVYVHLYNIDNGKCIRKIKCGKCHATAAVFKDEMVALVDHHKKHASIKLVSLQDGSKVGKFKVKHGNKDSLVEFSSDGKYLAVASAANIEIIDVSGKSETVTIQVPDKTTRTDFSHDQDEYTLLVETANTQQAHLYQLKSQAAELASSVSCPDDTIKSCRFFLLQNTLLVAATTHQNGKDETKIQQISFRDVDGKFESEIKVDLSPKPQENDSANGTKRKAPDNVKVLGPGQAGMEVHALTDGPPQTKRKKSDDNEDQDETIAQRLQRLTQEMLEEDDDDEGSENELQVDFNAKKATTESLSKLLQQALTSGDDAMLELALNVRNTKVIQQTISELDSTNIEKLLTRLTWKFASKPTRAQALSTWLQLVLCNGHTSTQVPMKNLKPLRNLLQERVESFPHLLQLQGRLSLMGGGYSK